LTPPAFVKKNWARGGIGSLFAVFGGIQKFDSAVAGFNAGSHQIIGGGKAFGIEFEGMGIGPKTAA